MEKYGFNVFAVKNRHNSGVDDKSLKRVTKKHGSDMFAEKYRHDSERDRKELHGTNVFVDEPGHLQVRESSTDVPTCVMRRHGSVVDEDNKLRPKLESSVDDANIDPHPHNTAVDKAKADQRSRNPENIKVKRSTFNPASAAVSTRSEHGSNEDDVGTTCPNQSAAEAEVKTTTREEADNERAAKAYVAQKNSFDENQVQALNSKGNRNRASAFPWLNLEDDANWSVTSMVAHFESWIKERQSTEKHSSERQSAAAPDDATRATGHGQRVGAEQVGLNTEKSSFDNSDNLELSLKDIFLNPRPLLGAAELDTRPVELPDASAIDSSEGTLLEHQDSGICEKMIAQYFNAVYADLLSKPYFSKLQVRLQKARHVLRWYYGHMNPDARDKLATRLMFFTEGLPDVHSSDLSRVIRTALLSLPQPSMPAIYATSPFSARGAYATQFSTAARVKGCQQALFPPAATFQAQNQTHFRSSAPGAQIYFHAKFPAAVAGKTTERPLNMNKAQTVLDIRDLDTEDEAEIDKWVRDALGRNFEFMYLARQIERLKEEKADKKKKIEMKKKSLSSEV